MPGVSKWSPSLRFTHQNPVWSFPRPRMCYMLCPSHSSWFDHPNNIWWGVQIIKLLVITALLILLGRYKFWLIETNHLWANVIPFDKIWTNKGLRCGVLLKGDYWSIGSKFHIRLGAEITSLTTAIFLWVRQSDPCDRSPIITNQAIPAYVLCSAVMHQWITQLSFEALFTCSYCSVQHV
jgi:hypothetical protein